MRRLSTIQPFSCVTCEIEIVGSPTFHIGLPFCCAGCAANGPCICSYDQDVTDASRVRHCADIADLVVAPRAAGRRAAAPRASSDRGRVGVAQR